MFEKLKPSPDFFKHFCLFKLLNSQGINTFHISTENILPLWLLNFALQSYLISNYEKRYL